ncbi:CoA transferase [Streptomyces sp. NPDC007157]|uniref:CaiB/BaiF CoA transferase family protein n=1 Tax=Streptomyces sp. NPDC007157 TaxID=3154681 RepID=UPI0033D3184B
MDTENELPSALSGIRVLDLSTVVMGPYAAQILGDLGADVIKVEAPSGDVSRSSFPQLHPGMSALALHVNRNKRSLGLNLKMPEGREAFLKLVETADVVVTNMRPGALQRLRLEHPVLAERNPRLVYCHAQGFRSDSRFADRAAYDEVVQAASGMVYLMQRLTGTPYYVPTILADKLCALTIVYSVLAALAHRLRTGEGQHVEVPMTDTLLTFNLLEHLVGNTFLPAAGPMGYSRTITPMHRASATSDGWACIMPYTPKNIRDFFHAAGRPELAEDERFASTRSLAQHAAELYELIEELAGEKTTAEWEQLCVEYSIPFAPVLTAAEVTQDPYITEGGPLTVEEHPTEGPHRVIQPPVRFSASPSRVRRHCPTIGQHTTEVLTELGYSEDEIARLIAEGAAGGSAQAASP